MLITNSAVENVAEASQQTASNSDPTSEVVLSVKEVSKKFCRDFKRALVYGVQDIAGELTGLRGSDNNKLRKKEFWALSDVDLELRRGEALGLVGKNGSGKSTLLRIIAGLIKPDKGEVEINGRIAPLIALGAGFNPVLTGRENIYANMSILGLTKEEIDEQFDEVLAFSEIGDAIDSPVQSYSSGMQARLGFSSAIHTKPDILLIDEVLAVGDVRFRAKCHRKLQELIADGASFILVSHASHEILNVCRSAVFLKQGKMIASGATSRIISQYEKDLFHGTSKDASGTASIHKKSEAETTGLDIEKIFLRSGKGEIVTELQSGFPGNVCLQCNARQGFDDINIYLVFNQLGGTGTTILHLSNFFDDKKLSLIQGRHELRLFVPFLCLVAGTYTLRVHIKSSSLYVLDSYDGFRFTVSSQEKFSRSLLYQPREWMICSEESINCQEEV